MADTNQEDRYASYRLRREDLRLQAGECIHEMPIEQCAWCSPPNPEAIKKPTRR